MQVQLQRRIIAGARYAAHKVIARQRNGTAPLIRRVGLRRDTDKTGEQCNGRAQTHYFATAESFLKRRIPKPRRLNRHRLNLSPQLGHLPQESIVIAADS